MLNTMSKIRGQVKNPGYPQAEGLLGECMTKYGRDLGEETNFGKMCVFVCVHSAPRRGTLGFTYYQFLVVQICVR